MGNAIGTSAWRKKRLRSALSRLLPPDDDLPDTRKSLLEPADICGIHLGNRLASNTGDYGQSSGRSLLSTGRMRVSQAPQRQSLLVVYRRLQRL